ncbi:MAG: hypothetical protein JNM34_03025 [Chthonomonadaceae bacterium]|nr:hypothetical protein [Chthonomonadaceae bacterium]
MTAGSAAYVGLGAGTGPGYDNIDALSWNLGIVPEPASMVVLSMALFPLRKHRSWS